MLQTVGKLNIKIRELENVALGTANDLRDQRDLTVRELSKRMDLHYYEDKNGMIVIRGPGDRLLVEGANAGSFQVVKNNESGLYEVVASDFEGQYIREIGTKTVGGSLHGMLDVRDRVISGLIDRNNELADTFVTEVNAIHRDGYGIGAFAMAKGRDFFDPVVDRDRAAIDMSISTAILNNTDAIGAASTINTPGDNVVVNALAALKDKKVLDHGEATFVDFYANMAGELGMEAVRANHIAEADKILVGDIESRREMVSGVSLDEEAANMIKWQTAFTASSKVITTVDEMLETVLSLKR
jgi:flagellar hook-associated protein 1 FlgK